MPLCYHPIGRATGCGMPLSRLHRAPVALRRWDVAGGLAIGAATGGTGDPAADLMDGGRRLATAGLPSAVGSGQVARLKAGAHRGGQVKGEEV